MKLDRGTPQTLGKAIDNAFEDFEKSESWAHSQLKKALIETVSDFIKNNLSPIALRGDDAVLKAVEKFSAKLNK